MCERIPKYQYPISTGVTEIHEADMCRYADRAWLLRLLDVYANDPMGGGQPLPQQVKDRIPEGLKSCPVCVILLAEVDNEPVGAAVCFKTYSTFAGAPILNIHDLIVHPRFRGRGIARAILAHVEKTAHSLDCCKITLEVLSNNTRAMGIYSAAGFMNYSLNPETGYALFMQKKLT